MGERVTSSTSTSHSATSRRPGRSFRAPTHPGATTIVVCQSTSDATTPEHTRCQEGVSTTRARQRIRAWGITREQSRTTAVQHDADQRAPANEERLGGDLAVASSAGEVFEDFEFPSGELGERLLRWWLGDPGSIDPVKEALGGALNAFAITFETDSSPSIHDNRRRRLHRYPDSPARGVSCRMLPERCSRRRSARR